MTVYNSMFRCDGGQKPPTEWAQYPRGKWLGRCSVCKLYFRMYPNGKVVMHKRKSRVSS